MIILQPHEVTLILHLYYHAISLLNSWFETMYFFMVIYNFKVPATLRGVRIGGLTMKRNDFWRSIAFPFSYQTSVSQENFKKCSLQISSTTTFTGITCVLFVTPYIDHFILMVFLWNLCKYLIGIFSLHWQTLFIKTIEFYCKSL